MNSADLSEAVDRAAVLHGQQWVVDMTHDAIDVFEGELHDCMPPCERLRLAVAAPVDDGKARPGLLLVTDSRFLIMWSDGLLGRRKHRESYPLGSVACSFTRSTVRGVPGEAFVLQLAARRVVVPSESLGLSLRASFTAEPRDLHGGRGGRV